MNNLHGIVFAYQSHLALRELTAHRNTALLPYGGRYRVIDFMLSNLVNAGICDVGLIVETRYQSLLDHVGSGKAWDLSRKHGGLRILPSFGRAGRRGMGGYRGRMDALSGVSSYLHRIRQDYVVLANGDLAANIPLAEAYEAHLSSGADITAVCTRLRRGKGPDRICFATDKTGRVGDVLIGPDAPVEWESLEVYILSRQLLLSLEEHCAARDISSFSGGVLRDMAPTLKIIPWCFNGYAARLQSVDQYFSASMELLDSAVRADLFHPQRGVRTKDRSDPSTYYGPVSRCDRCLVADGCIIEGEVKNSVLFRGVRVEEGAQVHGCILMQGTAVCRGGLLRYAIADKNVLINPGRMLMGDKTYPLILAKDSAI